MPNKSLRFVLPLCLLCGAILGAPFWLPRVLTALGSDEADVQPVLKVQEAADYIHHLQWSSDGRSWRYLADFNANRANQSAIEVERSWPDGRERSRRNLDDEIESAIAPKVLAVQRKFLYGDERRDELRVVVTQGTIVSTPFRGGAGSTYHVGRRLELQRGGTVLRWWPVPNYKKLQIFKGRIVGVLEVEVRAFLSPDGKTAAFLASWHDLARFKSLDSPNSPRELADLLSDPHHHPQRLEWHAFDVASGRLKIRRNFDNVARWQEEDAIWMGRFKNHAFYFDGRALWTELSPNRLPLDAPGRLNTFRAAQSSKNWQNADVQREYFWEQVRHTNQLASYDVLGKRAQWFDPPTVQSAPAHKVHWSWHSVFSGRRTLLAALNSANGEVSLIKNVDDRILGVWDVASRHLLWRKMHDSGGNHLVKFSPDESRLAVVQTRDGFTRRTAIYVFNARTGGQLGPPLLEESPRDRTRETSAKLQSPFKNGVKRVTDVFASPTPIGAPQPQVPDDGFTDFHWAPDNRHIIVHHRGAKLKVWRVP